MKTCAITQKIKQHRISILSALFLLIACGTFSWKHLSNQKKTQQIVLSLHLQDRFFWSSQEAIDQVVNGMVAENPLNYKILSCLEGRGENCKQYQAKEFDFHVSAYSLPRAFDLNSKPCQDVANCPIRRTSSFSVVCENDTSCEKINVKHSIVTKSSKSPVRSFEVSWTGKEIAAAYAKTEVANGAADANSEKAGVKGANSKASSVRSIKDLFIKAQSNGAPTGKVAPSSLPIPVTKPAQAR